MQKREQEIENRFQSLKLQRDQLKGLRRELWDLESSSQQVLERVAGQSQAEMAEELRLGLEAEALRVSQKRAQALEFSHTLNSELQAQRLMDLASQRYRGPLEVQRFNSQVALPKKKRVQKQLFDSGVLEALREETGVEFVRREQMLFLSCHDAFHREQARMSYLMLLKVGHFTLPLSRKFLSKARKDLNRAARKAGQRAQRVLGIKKLHPDLNFQVGKLMYRTSYSQNQWQHAIETARISGLMASELGLSRVLAERAGLLHDIGKVLWEETEALGSHALSGAALAEECGEVDEVVNAIAAHHGDVKPSSGIAHLVAASDALSGARPGARRETLEAYTQRVEDLQRICDGFSNINRSYVIQGGRELRIEVDPRQVNDTGVEELSTQVAQLVEEECSYPGQIKVVVIRERRSFSIAH